MALADLINQAYDTFAQSMKAPLASVNQANVDISNFADEQYGRNQGNIKEGNQAVLGALASSRNRAGQRANDSIRAIQQSIQNSLGAFGRNPQTIAGPPADYSELQPALTQYGNQTAAQFGSQAQGIGRAVGVQEANQQLTNNDYLTALANWRDLLKLSERNKAQQQRDALDREVFGANLERARTLANLQLQGA